ncbi:MAG TPA: hypothetical protein VMC62_08385 [Longilinea sp.]|nr:hypothetical protein [Longilinea sp.]
MSHLKHPSEESPSTDRPSLATPQILIMALIGLLFLVMLVWSEPFTDLYLHPTATQPVLTATPLPPGQPTPLPAQFIQTNEQTDTIIWGATLLVLIIIGGTMSFILRGRQR